MDSKKKRVTLTLKQKLDVLKRMEMGEPIKDIADEFGVGKSTLCLWKRKRPEIENIYIQAGSDTAKRVRRSAKQVKAQELDDQLYRWYSHQLAHKSRVTVQSIRHKAVSLNEELGGDSTFQPTDSWINSWKERFDSMQERNKRGRKSCDHSKEMIMFLTKVRTKILTDEFVSEQLYHIGDTSFNLKTIPRKGLDSKSVKILSQVSPNSDDSYVISLIACCNSVSSHKLPLIVLSHPSSNGDFNTSLVESETVFHRYLSDPKSIGALLETWFYEVFVPKVSEFLLSQHLPQKAILFVDYDSSFATIDDKLQHQDISVVFIPSQSCSHFRPMRQGIMSSLKKKYRRHLTNELITKHESELVDISQWLEAYNIDDAIKTLNRCWESIPSEMVIKSWQNLIPGVEKYYESPLMVSLTIPKFQAHYILILAYLQELACKKSHSNDKTSQNDEKFQNDENGRSSVNDK